jgi:hypothetical protein
MKKKEAKATIGKISRAESQRISNAKYALGEISKEEWEHQFDEMSNVRLWTAKGKVKDESDS